MSKTDRAAWLAERRLGIGGSDAAAVLGLSPWRTPVNVWLEKTGRAPEQEETEAMRIGAELEDYVARSYTRETGRRVQRYNAMLHDGCLLGNFDRLVIPDGEKIASHKSEVRTDTLLECKTSSREWEDGVPLHYTVQVSHYMGLCPRLEHADVAVLFLHRKHFEVFRVERDQETIDEMRRRLREWWAAYVETDSPPPPTGEADCKLLWASSNPGKRVEASAEVAANLQSWLRCKELEDEAKEEKKRYFNAVCAAMGDGEVLVGPDGKTTLLTWKSARSTEGVDWEAVAKELGASSDLIARHTFTKPGSRRFLAKVGAEDIDLSQWGDRALTPGTTAQDKE